MPRRLLGEEALQSAHARLPRPFGDVMAAIQREKTMKKWKRDWKINLIERENRHWCDLYPGLVGEVPSRAYWESKPNCQE